jgi:hypothetical protein
MENSWNPKWIPPARSMMKQFASRMTSQKWVLSLNRAPIWPQYLLVLPIWPTTGTKSGIRTEKTSGANRWIRLIHPIRDSMRYWGPTTLVVGGNPAEGITYPNLSKITPDMLPILAMSAELKFLFPGAKISITDRPNRIGNESTEALGYLKSWMSIKEFSDSLILVACWAYGDMGIYHDIVWYGVFWMGVRYGTWDIIVVVKWKKYIAVYVIYRRIRTVYIAANTDWRRVYRIWSMVKEGSSVVSLFYKIHTLPHDIVRQCQLVVLIVL